MSYKEPGFYNADCMEAMKEFPDGYFDLAIVDPPYGDGNSEKGSRHLTFGLRKKNKNYEVTRTGGKWASKYAKKIIEWDKAPEKAYFDELFRVSKNQIIWGGKLLSTATNEMLCYMAKVKHQ